MELHIDSQQWRRRLPDWSAAVVAGLVGGAVLMVLELLWSATMNREDPWRLSRLVAAIVMGPQTLQSSAFDPTVVTVALITHYVLGIVFGLVLALVIARFHYEGSAGMLEVIGLGFGAVLYLLNFYGMAAAFPWIAELRTWATFIGHLVFGLTVVLAYAWLQRRRVAEQTAA